MRYRRFTILAKSKGRVKIGLQSFPEMRGGARTYGRSVSASADFSRGGLHSLSRPLSGVTAMVFLQDRIRCRGSATRGAELPNADQTIEIANAASGFHLHAVGATRSAIAEAVWESQ